MNEEIKNDEKILLVKKVKDELVNTALEAFATASGDGVCCEGAWECAIDAVKNLTPEEIIERVYPANKI